MGQFASNDQGGPINGTRTIKVEKDRLITKIKENKEAHIKAYTKAVVAYKEEAITALDVEYAEKARQAEVELEISMKANTDRVVTEFLKNSDKVAISKSELASLQKELVDTKANADSETKKQVAIVASSLKSQYENEIKLIHSENKSSAVENTSKIAALQEKNAFLEGQVNKMYQQMDAERSASIERAKAGSVGSINVTSDRK